MPVGNRGKAGGGELAGDVWIDSDREYDPWEGLYLEVLALDGPPPSSRMLN